MPTECSWRLDNPAQKHARGGRRSSSLHSIALSTMVGQPKAPLDDQDICRRSKHNDTCIWGHNRGICLMGLHSYFIPQLDPRGSLQNNTGHVCRSSMYDPRDPLRWCGCSRVWLATNFLPVRLTLTLSLDVRLFLYLSLRNTWYWYNVYLRIYADPPIYAHKGC